MNAAVLLLLGAAVALLASLAYRLTHRPTGRPASAPRFAFIGGRRVRRRARERQARPPRRSPARAALGIGIGLAALGAGVVLLGVKDRPVPEQRGVGVVVSPVHPLPGRGLALSAGIHVRSCGEPVRVTIIASGTAEFWVDNAKMMRREGSFRMAVPDLHLSNITIRLGSDGKTATVAPLSELPDSDLQLVRLPVKRLQSVTVIGARIPHWGVHLRPVMVSFDADWLRRRSYLGSCYLRLPALAGFPTVLSAREILGQAAEDINTLKDRSIFVVSSEETKLQAYYDSEFETTRGLTSIDIGSKALRTDLSQPGPDTNVRGEPSWSCSTRPPRSVSPLESVHGTKVPDIVEGAAANASGALSITRLGDAIGERTCASYAVLEESGAGIARDIAALLIGALFSTGVGLASEGLRRRRPEAA